jgi:hypothetical protein
MAPTSAVIDRRAALCLTSATLVLSGCIAEDTQNDFASGEAPIAPLQARSVPAMTGNRVLSPQVVYGHPSATSYTEAALSLHCGATRTYTASTLRGRLAEARSGRRLVVLSHYVRTANEIPLGIELLQTGDRYPEALLAMLGLSARVGRALSAAEASQYLTCAGFSKSPGIRAQDARVALGTVRVAYDEAGLLATPFIREG